VYLHSALCVVRCMTLGSRAASTWCRRLTVNVMLLHASSGVAAARELCADDGQGDEREGRAKSRER